MAAKQLLIAIDQFANAILGGMADETLSARAFRWEVQGHRIWPRQMIDGLFFWQSDHCYHAWRSELERRQLPSHYRVESCTTS